MATDTKTAGRKPTIRPPAVPDVETLTCPAVPGDTVQHRLTNDPNANSSCVFCRQTWAELDRSARRKTPVVTP